MKNKILKQDWFPGHIFKNKKIILEQIKNIDVIIEILDSRIPYSCLNYKLFDVIKNKNHIIILNKSDLSNNYETNRWIEYFKEKNKECIKMSLKNNTNFNIFFKILKKIYNLICVNRKKNWITRKIIKRNCYWSS